MNENGEIAVFESSTALEALTRAEVDVQIATAHQHPRAVSKCIDQMKALATLTPEIAASMTWIRDVGKGNRKDGPSVRLAEIVASCWGNISAGSRVIEIGESAIVAQGITHDLEKNYRYQHETRRRILDKNGKRYTEANIIINANAACSIAFREAVFHAVPRSIVNSVWDEAKRVALSDDKGFLKRRQNAFAWFAKKGADTERVLAALGRTDLEQITSADVQTLQGIFQAMETGETTLDEAIPPLAMAFSTATSEGTEPPSTPPAGPSPQRRRATRPTLIGGHPVKTAGIAGETADAVINAAAEHPEGAAICKAHFEELNIAQKAGQRWRSVRYLREEEGQALLKRLAPPQPEDQLPASFDGPPAQEAEVVPETSPEAQNGDSGDIPPNPVQNPWDDQGTPPGPAQGDARGTTAQFAPDLTIDQPISVDNWDGPPPPVTNGEEECVGRFVSAYRNSPEDRVLITCPVIDNAAVFPFMCNHCGRRYDDSGNPCPAWERST
jgi:hypothetical protein